jgi:hypothetical protein
VRELLDRNRRTDAAAFIAAYALWVCDAVPAGELGAQEADEAFTRLDVYLDNRPEPPFSDALEELIFEAGHLHHYGDPPGGAATPDLDFMRQLAVQALSEQDD